MKEIILTNNQIALVDDEEYEWLNSFKWYAKKANKYNHGYYAVRQVRKNGKQRNQYMHKLILGIDDTNILGDHIDGNKLNNTRKNLRKATKQENNRNSKIQSNNTTGFKGVSWVKRENKFISRIILNKKIISLGYFEDPVLAAKKYDSKAKELFGEFANVNFKMEM